MTNPVLPSALKPITDGYSMDDPRGVMRTEVSGGAARFGLEWDRGPQRFNITFILDSLQFSAWTLFYFHVIRKGAIAFDMPIDSGFGVQVHTVNIMPGTYSAARTSGIMTTVNFVAEADSKAYEFSADAALTALALYESLGAGFTSLFDEINQFANVDLNVLDFE